MAEGYIDAIEQGSSDGLFTGKIGNVEFRDAKITFHGNAINSIKEISVDTYASYDSTPIKELKVSILVDTTDNMDRQNTITHIRNVVAAVQKETATHIKVDITKA